MRMILIGFGVVIMVLIIGLVQFPIIKIEIQVFLERLDYSFKFLPQGVKKLPLI